MAATQHKGEQLGAYVITFAPEGIVFIEKPGRGRGLEFPGGHGEADDANLAEVAERELYQETGIQVDPDDMRLIGEPRVTETHTSGILLVQIPRLPKTLRKVGDGGEIVHVVRPRDLKKHRFFPPHQQYLDTALRMLESVNRPEAKQKAV